MSGEPQIVVIEMDYGDPRLPERFWEKVYPCPITGCWLWGAASHDTLPYGIWRVGNRTARAHVSAFVAGGGLLSAEKPNVLHSCDQPACVNPEHLRAGTQAENADDARRRHRLAVGAGSPLNPSKVVELRERYAAGESTRRLSMEFGITTGVISMIVRGLHWASAGGPLTFNRPRLGSPSPAGTRPTCNAGHALTPDNVRLKPNKACRSGFERQCIACRKRHNKDSAARRKAARAAARERTAA